MCGVIGEQLHVRRGVRGKIPTIRERHRSRDVRDGDGVGKNVPGQGEEIKRGPRWLGCRLTPNVRGANELVEGGGRGEVGPSDDSKTIDLIFVDVVFSFHFDQIILATVTLKIWERETC